MSENVKILVISDLHVGPKARAKDFRTESNDDSCAITENYINDFRSFIQKEQIKANYLIIAGDISDRALPEEFELAAERIKDIMNILDLNEKNVFFVPGNHDGNWDEEKRLIEQDYSSEAARNAKYLNISNNAFFNKLLEQANYSLYYTSPYSSIWMDDYIVIVGINSSAYDKYDKKYKFGEINLECLDNISDEIEKLKEQWDNKFKILLTHHHPISYTDKTFPDPDLSQMVNAEDFLNFSHKYEFDFIIHGHKHIPRFKSSVSHDVGYTENILSAGSFSADLKNWHNGVPNHFHLIEYHGCCSNNGYPRGKVLSWSYFMKHKWLPSSFERDDINGEEYFGFFTSKKQMKKIIEEIIKKKFVSKDNITWKEFLAENGDLLYCNRSLLFNVIEELRDIMNFEFMRSQNQFDFVLWRND